MTVRFLAIVASLLFLQTAAATRTETFLTQNAFKGLDSSTTKTILATGERADYLNSIDRFTENFSHMLGTLKNKFDSRITAIQSALNARLPKVTLRIAQQKELLKSLDPSKFRV